MKCTWSRLIAIDPRHHACVVPCGVVYYAMCNGGQHKASRQQLFVQAVTADATKSRNTKMTKLQKEYT